MGASSLPIQLQRLYFVCKTQKVSKSRHDTTLRLSFSLTIDGCPSYLICSIRCPIKAPNFNKANDEIFRAFKRLCALCNLQVYIKISHFKNSIKYNGYLIWSSISLRWNNHSNFVASWFYSWWVRLQCLAVTDLAADS